MKSCIILIVAVVILTACGVQHNTASGKPEICVPTTNINQLSDTIVNDMSATGYTIISRSPNKIVIQKIAGKTNWFGVTPYQRSIIDIIPTTTCTRVIIDFTFVQKKGAEEDITSLNNSALSKNVETYLNKLNARYSGK